MWVDVRLSYLADLAVAAWSAAAPAVIEVLLMWESAICLSVRDSNIPCQRFASGPGYLIKYRAVKKNLWALYKSISLMRMRMQVFNVQSKTDMTPV